jgi:hypothetical protein
MRSEPCLELGNRFELVANRYAENTLPLIVQGIREVLDPAPTFDPDVAYQAVGNAKGPSTGTQRSTIRDGLEQNERHREVVGVRVRDEKLQTAVGRR